VLRCAAVCCSVLQCVAVCCSELPCVAVCCSVLQCVAVYCRELQCVAVCCSMLRYAALCCSVLQCVAVLYRYVLQCVAVCCSVFTVLRPYTKTPNPAGFEQTEPQHAVSYLLVLNIYSYTHCNTLQLTEQYVLTYSLQSAANCRNLLPYTLQYTAISLTVSK